MSATIYESIDLNTAYDNRHRECPECGSAEIAKSDNCHEQVTEGISNKNAVGVSGVYCKECGWFKLNNSPTLEEHTSKDNGDSNDIPPVEELAKLPSGETVHLSDYNVKQIAESKIIIKEKDGCPKCGCKIEITLTNSHDDDSNIYKPLKSVCGNYSSIGRGCSYREDGS